MQRSSAVWLPRMPKGANVAVPIGLGLAGPGPISRNLDVTRYGKARSTAAGAPRMRVTGHVIGGRCGARCRGFRQRLYFATSALTSSGVMNGMRAQKALFPFGF
jgi:hypothetical protein